MEESHGIKPHGAEEEEAMELPEDMELENPEDGGEVGMSNRL